jgi:hypothetical protein
MIEIPVLTSVIKAIVWLFRLIHGASRIKDGTTVSLSSAGDGESDRTELLFIGLKGTEQTCLVQFPIIVTNDGRAPVRNIAIRITLPKQLSVNVLRDNEAQSGVYQTEDGLNAYFNIEMPSLRIDDSVLLPMLLRITPNDWIDVKADGPQKQVGRTVLVDYDAELSVRIVALRVRVTVHADNIRAVSRRWEVWMTPAKSLRELKKRRTALVTIQRIWNMGFKAFSFPLIGSLVWMPLSMRQFQSAALMQLTSNQFAVAPETGLFFQILPNQDFIPVQFHKRVAVNPGKRRAAFRNWVQNIRHAKSTYYA